MLKVKIIKGKNGQRPLKFHEGGLHESTGTPSGSKIPASKVTAALHGTFGAKARKQALFYENVLKH